MSKPGIQVEGLDKLVKKLRAMASPQTAKRIMRKVTNAATTPLLAAVRNTVPDDTGALRRSIAKKIIGRNGNYQGIVGSDITKPDKDGKDFAVHHLHLVEFGFEHVGGQVVPGQFPLLRAQLAARSQVASVYESVLKAEIEKEAAKGGT